MLKKSVHYILLCIVMLSPGAHARSIEDLITRDKRPEGVVIEIVSGDRMLLNTLLPELNEDIQRLRHKYPDLPIAIVTHGQEQFMLTKNNRSEAERAHGIVEQLAVNDDIEVHVCGTYAGWFGVSENDFPKYVNVAPAGPVQINNYEELGYELITLP
jgi:intracellular sulfur oxidation DsrE/DsrF family protein